MSMIGSFRRISARDLAKLQADPALVPEFLGDEGGDAGFDPFADLDVDKAWHGIHYLLTGTAEEGAPPLDFIMRGGRTLGEDLGYGPARGFSPGEVKDIAAALSAVSPEQLRSRYDQKEMQRLQIYPDIWRREPDEGLEFVMESFDELREFIIGGAKEGEALVVFLS
jgi:Domain of unknown function (DUF1877)